MIQKKNTLINAAKFFAVLVIFASLLLGSYTYISAASGQTEVRVGLFHNSSAQECYYIKSEEGLEVGYSQNGEFKKLFDEPTDNIITVRKDAYIKNDENLLSEYGYDRDESALDYFHIQIGDDFSSQREAKSQVNALQRKDIKAFPVFAGSWQVWTGFYTDSKNAQEELKKVEEELDGKLNCKVIKPSQSRIAVLTNKYSNQSDSYTTYKVQSGDTLSKIAAKFNMTVAELKSINQMTSDFIRTEQVLKVKSYGLKDSQIELMFDAGSNLLRIKPDSEPGLLEINNQTYRGGLEFKRVLGSDMTAINVVGIEEYLYGVVPSEVGSSSSVHYEAMKAQAVIARTYVLNTLGRHGSYGFDLCTTEHCQVYKGIMLEKAATNEAVNATAGETVRYNGQLAQVYYSSSNGGNTEEVKHVWNPKLEIPYIKSFQDRYDPAESWEVTLTAEQIRSITGDKIGNIQNVVVTKYSSSGRAVELKIKGDRDELTYSREECRSLFGLPSQLYTINGSTGTQTPQNPSSTMELRGKSVITKEGIKKIDLREDAIKVVSKNGLISVKELLQMKTTLDSTNNGVSSSTGSNTTPGIFKFAGKGRGHGIGLSQKGAIAMAGAGNNYKQILQYYFPGTEIR